jgi:predicted peptidase
LFCQQKTNRVSPYQGFSIDPFSAHQYQASTDFVLNYRMLEPEQAKPGIRYPLVLILHSSGTPIGTDNTSQLTILPRMWLQPSIREKYPAFVIAPQFPGRTSNYATDSTRKVLASVAVPELSVVTQLIDSLKNVLPVDPQRIYVMGFSMGGSSTINIMEQRPDLFAAAISISGIPSFNRMEELSTIPTWLIHGNADTENPPQSDKVFYTEQKKLHNRLLLFWEIDGLEHEIYYQLYSSDIVPAWLFGYRNKRGK